MRDLKEFQLPMIHRSTIARISPFDMFPFVVSEDEDVDDELLSSSLSESELLDELLEELGELLDSSTDV